MHEKCHGGFPYMVLKMGTTQLPRRTPLQIGKFRAKMIISPYGNQRMSTVKGFPYRILSPSIGFRRCRRSKMSQSPRSAADRSWNSSFVFVAINGKSPANQQKRTTVVDYQRLTMRKSTGQKTWDFKNQRGGNQPSDSCRIYQKWIEWKGAFSWGDTDIGGHFFWGGLNPPWRIGWSYDGIDGQWRTHV